MAALVVLCLCLGLGHLLRHKMMLLQKLYLPSCLIGGVAAIFFIRILNIIAGKDTILALSLFREETYRIWQTIPGLLINVVFACLFLGAALPKSTVLCKRSVIQLAYGQIVAWGHYVVALGLWFVCLAKLFPDLPVIFASILPTGFSGGIHTAEELSPIFMGYGWFEGQSLVVSITTFGILSAMILGTILVNWAVRKGHVTQTMRITQDPHNGIIPIEQRPSAGKLTVSSHVIECLSLHLVIVGLAIGLGILMKSGLVKLESRIPYLARHSLLNGVPLFSLCMIGGYVIQWIEIRFDRHRLIDLGLIRRIQNTALEFLVVAAIATIPGEWVTLTLLPMSILVCAGIVWNVVCVMFLAQKILKDAWFERAIIEMGQSMGTTAIGLLLLRMVDPEYETPAAQVFAYKQLIHEPIMASLWTGLSVSLIVIHGPGTVLTIAFCALMLWFLVLCTARFISSRT